MRSRRGIEPIIAYTMCVSNGKPFTKIADKSGSVIFRFTELANGLEVSYTPELKSGSIGKSQFGLP